VAHIKAIGKRQFDPTLRASGVDGIENSGECIPPYQPAKQRVQGSGAFLEQYYDPDTLFKVANQRLLSRGPHIQLPSFGVVTG